MNVRRAAAGETLRQVLHLLCGGGAVLLYYWPKWAVVGMLLLGIILVYVARLYAERHDTRIPLFRTGESASRNGAVRYAIGVSIACILFPRFDGFIGWLIFAGGDAASSLAGRRWPIRTILSNRSLGGALAFILVGFGLGLFGRIWWTGGATMIICSEVLLVAVLCAVAELLIPNVDDNYYLPRSPPRSAG